MNMWSGGVVGSAEKGAYGAMTEFAKEMRAMPTAAERSLWERLKNRGIGAKFRQQHIIGRFIVDFVCLEHRLIVEVDGPMHDRQKEADAERESCLDALGYATIRFSNNEIHEDLDSVLLRIQEAIWLSTKTNKSTSLPNLPL